MGFISAGVHRFLFDGKGYLLGTCPRAGPDAQSIVSRAGENSNAPRHSVKFRLRATPDKSTPFSRRVDYLEALSN
jgi:hypothetical protein